MNETAMHASSTVPSRPLPKVLVGQKALVTGANSGIGRAVAIALGQAGAEVVVNYVVGTAEDVVQQINESGAKSYAYKADVSNEGEVQSMFRDMMTQFGTIDILVNNAGLQRDSAFHDMTLAQWNMVINVNRESHPPGR